MRLNTRGLIIRTLEVGESDRAVTVLTKDCGVVHAFARRSRAAKSALVSATQLFCYSELTLFEGKTANTIDDAQPIEVFFELRQDLARLSLAQYFCELVGVLAPEDDGAGDFLRLLLNAFYLMCKQKHPLSVIKAAVEMRMLSLAGYMPDLICCKDCGAYEADLMLFSPREGTLTCDSCCKGDYKGMIPLHRGALTALRHTIYADFSKLFSFSLSEEGLKELNRASESYIINTLERSFQTLDFYHSIKEDENSADSNQEDKNHET